MATGTPSASDLDIIAEVEAEHGSYETDALDFSDDAPETTTDETETEEAGTTPAEPEAESEDATPREPEPEPDPLADAKPYTYSVDGQSKPFDGIRVTVDKDGKPTGAVVSVDALPALGKQLGRAEYYETVNKQLYSKTQEYERLSFKDGSGAEHKGLRAFETAVVENAKLTEVVKLFADLVENPDKLIPLAFAIQNGDDSALQSFRREIGIVAKETAFNARQSFGKQRQDATEQASQSEQVEAITSSSIKESIRTWSPRHPTLTAEDLSAVEAQLMRVGSAVVRPATPEEARAAGVKPGDRIIDHPYIDSVLADRAKLREAAIASSKAAEQAAKQNTNAINAANRGKPQAKKPSGPKAPAPKAPAGPTYEQIKRAAMKGQFLTEVVGDDDDE